MHLAAAAAMKVCADATAARQERRCRRARQGKAGNNLWGAIK